MRFVIKGSPREIVTLTLAGLSLLLVIVNTALVARDQSIQADVTQRQQAIDQEPEFARIRQALAQVLGNFALSQNDHDLTDLLSRHGIAVTPQQAAPASLQGK